MSNVGTYEDQLKKMFARYGFIEPPLTDEQIERCRTDMLTLDEAYNVGCDGYCTDYTFEEVMQFHKQAREEN